MVTSQSAALARSLVRIPPLMVAPTVSWPIAKRRMSIAGFHPNVVSFMPSGWKMIESARWGSVV
ncbi:MAG: hypothetical protein ABI884_00830, partial [Gemmatimonadota bacterium]